MTEYSNYTACSVLLWTWTVSHVVVQSEPIMTWTLVASWWVVTQLLAVVKTTLVHVYIVITDTLKHVNITSQLHWLTYRMMYLYTRISVCRRSLKHEQLKPTTLWQSHAHFYICIIYSSIFTVRCCVAPYILWCCVCLSVTSQSSVKTAKRSIVQIRNSMGNLMFWSIDVGEIRMPSLLTGHEMQVR